MGPGEALCCPAHVSFGHYWNEQIESEQFIRAVGTHLEHMGGAMKALRPNAHLQHELPRARKHWKSNYAYLTIIPTNMMPFKSVLLSVKVAIPPWWCDKLPPLARISSLAACCAKKDKTLKQIMKSNGVVTYKGKKSNQKWSFYTSTCS